MDKFLVAKKRPRIKLEENQEVEENQNKDEQEQAVLSDISVSKFAVPKQPILQNFPVSDNKRKFSSNYYKLFNWIEYSVQDNSVFCFACRHFAGQALFKGEKDGKRTFIDVGFNKWKDIKALLTQHDLSARHKSSIISWIDWKSVQRNQQPSVASKIVTSRSLEIQENRAHIKILLRVAAYLGRQGLPFRGHDEDDESKNRGNFLELLEEFAKDDDILKERLVRRYGHYTSPEYQNDLIQVIGNKIETFIVSEIINSNYFAILVDETKDISKKEQLALIFRYFHDGKIKEKTLGCYHMKFLDAKSLSEFIYHKVKSYGIDWNNCVAQCYDGASVMSGWANGVQAQVKEFAPKANYIHCYCHRLNLVLINCIENIIEIKFFFKTVSSLYNFIANSNTRHELFIDVQTRLQYTTVLRLERTSTTRWFYWYRSLSKIKLRFQAILVVLDISSVNGNANDRAEALGYKKMLIEPNFCVLLHILELVLNMTNSLSEILQKSDLTIFDAINCIESTHSSLQQMRNDDNYNTLIEKAEKFAEDVGISLELDEINNMPAGIKPKRHKLISSLLSEFIVSSTIGQGKNHEETLRIKMKKFYFQVLDRFINEFDRRFKSNMKLFQCLDVFNINSSNFLDMEKIELFASLYYDSVDVVVLSSQITSAKSYFQLKSKDYKSLFDFYDELVKVSSGYTELLKLCQIYFTIPVSTASNERFFSVLKHVKTYLRATCGNERLSHLLLMAVEQSLVKSMDFDDLIDDFGQIKTRRYPLI